MVGNEGLINSSQSNANHYQIEVIGSHSQKFVSGSSGDSQYINWLS